MDYPIKNILDEKQKALDLLAKSASKMSAEAYDIITNLIEKEFDFKGGNFVVDENFIERLNFITARFISDIQRNKVYMGEVGKFVKRFIPIKDAIDEFQSKVNNIKAPPPLANETQFAIDATLDNLVDNGLNQHFVQPLRDIVYQNAASGISLKETKTQIKKYIGTGKDKSGKLRSYLDQTAQQGVSLYTGLINKKFLEKFKHNALLIAGTIIDNTSPQCKYAINDLNGIIKRTDWPALEKIAEKHGLMKNTTFDNLPVNLLHWNCRHDFFPIMIKD